jgi:DNA helicase-2/ATP-dependent DNA helicase PcrA
VTRAKKRVYLLYADRRNLYGSSTGEASRFISDIPGNLVEKQYFGDSSYEEEGYTSVTDLLARAALTSQKAAAAVPPKKLADLVMSKPQPPPKPSITVSVGERVRHKTFGEGTVIGQSGSSDDPQVTVNFDTAGVKRLLMSYANLEKA